MQLARRDYVLWTFVQASMTNQSLAKPSLLIEAISYAPVGAKRDDIWDECVVGTDIQEPVKGRFVRFILRCYQGEHGDFGDVEFNTDSGKRLKKQLTKIKALPLDKENLERRAVTKEIAANLSAKMADIGGGLAGAIFVVQARVDDKMYLAVLKLDLKPHEIVALQGTKGHRELFSQVFERALPEETKGFRKGIIFPSPVATPGSDAWSVQYDHPSDYWQHFVGARPRRAARKTREAITKTVTEALREEGKEFTQPMVVKLEEKLSSLDEVTPGTIATAIKQATGLAKRVPNIEEKLVQNAGRTELTEVAPLKGHRFEFRDGMKITVPFALARDRVVTVDQEGRDVVIRIKQSKFTRRDLVGDVVGEE